MKKVSKIVCIVLVCLLLFSACGNISDMNTPDERNVSRGEYESVAPSTQEIIGTKNDIAKDDNDNPNALVRKGKDTGTTETLTGYEKLPTVTLSVSDPNNSKNLSTKKVSHSHGPAANGKPHQTVLDFQKNFDKYNAFTIDNNGGKVLYLTFDCGYEYNDLTSKILDTLKEKDVPAAFFCTLHHIKDQPELITRMIKEGHIVGNHSTNHPSFAEIDRTTMAKELEECDNYLRENFGYSAKFFRFPAGEYNDNALDLINSVGFVSVFWSVAYADWDVNASKGKDYTVSTIMDRIHPGAVILLHSVSQDNADALGEIIDKARQEGYEFKSLDEYKFN